MEIRGIKIRGNISSKHRFSIISRDQVTKYRPLVATLIILSRYQKVVIRFLRPGPLSIEACNSLHRFSIFFTALDLFVASKCIYFQPRSRGARRGSRIKVQFLSISFVNSTQRFSTYVFPVRWERKRDRESIDEGLSSRIKVQRTSGACRCR